MKTAVPPRLPFALLQRFVTDNDPLIGDLVEQFARRQSRLWFWHQVLVAIVMTWRKRTANPRPLRLVDEPSAIHEEEFRRGHHATRINLSASPLPDVGGLGVFLLVALLTMVRPEAWWMMLSALLGGVVLGAVLVTTRRRRVMSAPVRGRSALLFGADDDG
jgi:hypothetical protein